MNVKLINGNTYDINKWTVNRLFKEVYQIYKDWGLTGADYGSACQGEYRQIKYLIEEKDYERAITHLVYTIDRMHQIEKDLSADDHAYAMQMQGAHK